MHHPKYMYDRVLMPFERLNKDFQEELIRGVLEELPFFGQSNEPVEIKVWEYKCPPELECVQEEEDKYIQYVYVTLSDGDRWRLNWDKKQCYFTHTSMITVAPGTDETLSNKD